MQIITTLLVGIMQNSIADFFGDFRQLTKLPLQTGIFCDLNCLLHTHLICDCVVLIHPAVYYNQ